MRAALVLGAALVAALALSLWHPPADRPAVVEAAPDLTGVWSIDWTATTRQRIGGQPVTNGVTLRGAVSLSRVDGGREALRFTRIDALSLTLGDDAQAAPGAALIGPALVFERDEHGAPTRIWTAPDAPPGFAHLATAAARRLTVLRADATREITPLGAAEVQHAAGLRTRRYAALRGADASPTGESMHRFDGVAITDHEALTAGDLAATVNFNARRIGPATPTSAPLALTEHRADAPSRTAEERALIEQAGDLDAQRLLGDLRGFAATGASPDSRWIWQAVGRLRLEPHLADQLAALLPTVSPFGQALIADLLASAGHPAAQAALRRALDDPRLMAAPVQRARLLQRLGFVKAPTDETVAWVAEQAGSDDVRIRRAAHLTRGGIARRIADPTAILTALTAATEAADPAEARAAVAGLGNSAHPDAAPTIRAHADAEDPAMRRTAAQALRGMPDADATLIGMSADPVDKVQQAALAALNQRALGPATARGLEAQVRDGAIRDAQRNQLVGLAEKGGRGDGAEDWRPVLEALLERANGDPRLAARIRRLLRSRS